MSAVVGGLCGVLALALVGPASSASAADGGPATTAQSGVGASIAASSDYYLRLRLNQAKCAEIPGYSTANSTQADVWTCVNQANVKWQIVAAGDYAGIATYYIKNSYSKKCLNVAGHSPANKTKIIQYTCSSALNNRWVLFSHEGYYELKSIDTNGYINVAGATATNGAKLIEWNGFGYVNQDFFLDLA